MHKIVAQPHDCRRQLMMSIDLIYDDVKLILALGCHDKLKCNEISKRLTAVIRFLGEVCTGNLKCGYSKKEAQRILKELEASRAKLKEILGKR